MVSIMVGKRASTQSAVHYHPVTRLCQYFDFMFRKGD